MIHHGGGIIGSIFLAAALLFTLGISTANTCPPTIPCPYDGYPLYYTGNCRGIGSDHVCEYEHEEPELIHGEYRSVKHEIWIHCGR